MEFGAERRFIRNKLVMAIYLTSVLYSYVELVLVVDEDITYVHLSDGELSLRSFTLTCHVEWESFLRAGDVAEGSARVVVGSLRFEGHTASDLSVRPNLALKRFYGENLILEKH